MQATTKPKIQEAEIIEQNYNANLKKKIVISNFQLCHILAKKSFFYFFPSNEA